MISALKKIFSPQPYQQEAHQLYVTLVEQARAPLFYSEYEVPDTIDGRFDMIVLHVCLLCKRLRDIDTDASIELSRALMETFFADMDRSLREMGSTDTGVGKRIKKMSQAYFGRLQAYVNIDHVQTLVWKGGWVWKSSKGMGQRRWLSMYARGLCGHSIGISKVQARPNMALAQLWTLKRVGAVIHWLFRSSLWQVWRIFCRLGFSPQKPEKRAMGWNEDAVRAWKRRNGCA